MTRRVLPGLVAVLLLAAALRFYRLDHQSFWNDEGNSARLSERSVALILEGTASDIHPPLYYLILRGWRELGGASELWLRALSAYSGVLLVAATWALGRRLHGRANAAAAGFGALFVAVSPPLVYYSQEARMYALQALLATLGSALLIPLLRSRRGRPPLAAAYVIVTAAGLYTHYFYPAVIAAQGLVALLWPVLAAARPPDPVAIARSFGRWLALALIALALYLPWLPIFLRQAGGRVATQLPLGEFLLDAGRWLSFGDTLPDGALLPSIALALLIIVGALVARGRAAAGALLALLVPPIAALWLAGAARPEFYKFILVAVPPLGLLAGLGAGALWTAAAVLERPPPIARLAALALVVLVGWAAGRSLLHLYFDPATFRADYRGIARQIAAEAHPAAAVILDAPNQWEVFTYYHRLDEPGSAPVYPLPRGQADAGAIAAELGEIAAANGRLYALFWGDEQQDPARLVERWLDAHAYKAREVWVSDVRFVTYAVPGPLPAAMAVEANVRFGDEITLLGYTVGAEALPAGDILPVALFWQTAAPLDTRFKVFLHLVDAAGQIAAQRDTEPGGGLALTTTWVPGEAITDPHGLFLPSGLPPGRYTLRLGLYDLTDPVARLPVTTDAGLSDMVDLGSLTILP